MKINWPAIILIAGCLVAAAANNLLAAALWLGGTLFGYVVAVRDVRRQVTP